MTSYGSTSDQRTAVGEGTRAAYRTLSEGEKAIMNNLKEGGMDLITECQTLRAENPDAAREYSIAITKIEEAVMWAVKGLTK